MSTPDALVVLAHGSPDPDWMRPVEAAAERVRRLAPACAVRTAALEHGPDLAAAVRSLEADGRRTVAVVPLFLSDGGRHLKRDIPALVHALRASFPGVTLHLVPGALGTDDAVLDALADAAVRRAGLR